MYFEGEGVPLDYAVALPLYRKAADQGYAKSQYNLGNMYYYGYGVQQDRVEADRWYHKAADQGDEYAQRALGLRGTGLNTASTIGLLTMSLYCLWRLKDSSLLQRSPQNRQQGTLTLAELFGLAWVGLMVYGAYGIFPSVLLVNIFDFAKNCVIGITVALILSVIGPRISKAAMGISGMLFVGITLLVIAHHDLRSFTETIYAICSLDGLLLGISISLAIVLWLRAMKSTRGEQAG
jgi:hypothetical protein